MTKKQAANADAEASKRKKAPTKKPPVKKPAAPKKKTATVKGKKPGTKSAEAGSQVATDEDRDDRDDELDAIEAAAAEAVEVAEAVPPPIVDDFDDLDDELEATPVRDEALQEAIDDALDDELDDALDDIDDIEDAQILAETPTAVAVVQVTAGDEDTDLEGVPAAPLTEEERELSAMYGEELAAPATAHAEFQDRQTADEDRPMTPEINARDERRAQWQDRRDRRRSRREQRDRERQDRRDHRAQQPQEARPAQGASPPRPPTVAAVAAVAVQAPVTNGHDGPVARVGTPLGDAAATVFAQLRNGQPLPVRQLAAMMRKRNLIEVDPEQLAPQLKAELLGDERSYRTLGLRPRIVYRGRDLFAPGPVAMSQTADAEANVASALSRLAGATHKALSARIARASGPGFERLIHAYLVTAGYREIAWVKRLGGISYASAIAPGIDRTVLISARSGDQPIDRRGIGELRVGVEAKNLVAGILFSTRELSEDAERELERAGRSIAVICGDQLVAMLIASGVGVVSAAAPLHYVDDQLLDELLAG